MKLRFMLKLMGDSIFNKKLVVILLLAMSSISLYMTDVIATKHCANAYYITSMSSMFGINPDKVNYVKYLNLMDPDYTTELGDELIKYIREQKNVLACGRFSNNSSGNIMDGNVVSFLVVEKDIVNIGNLGIDDEGLKEIEGSDSNLVYVGYSYRNDFKIGDEFNIYGDTEGSSCIVAGYLKKGASWPIKGDLFGGVTNLDSYNLDEKLVIITGDYYSISPADGMPDTPYFIVDEDCDTTELSGNIVRWAVDNNLGVKVVNENELISQEKKDNNLTEDSSFMAGILLFILVLISMSAAAIVSCLLKKQQTGIMIACGVSKRQITLMNCMENALIVVLPAAVVWLIRQKELFGDISASFSNNLNMLDYSYYYGHCVAVPIIYLIILIVVTVVSGIIPALIISRMKVADVIKPND